MSTWCTRVSSSDWAQKIPTVTMSHEDELGFKGRTMSYVWTFIVRSQERVHYGTVRWNPETVDLPLKTRGLYSTHNMLLFLTTGWIGQKETHFEVCLMYEVKFNHDETDHVLGNLCILADLCKDRWQWNQSLCASALKCVICVACRTW